MKTPTSRTAVCLSLLLSAPLSAHAQAPKTPSAPNADTAVAAAQTNLQRLQAGYQAGLNTTVDVDEAKAALAAARVRAALVQGKTDTITADLAVIQVQRQDLLRLTQIRFQAGVVGTTDLTQAQAALAEAQVSTALFTLWTVRHQALIQTQAMMRAGLVPSSDVDKAAATAQAVLTQFTDSLPKAQDDSNGK